MNSNFSFSYKFVVLTALILSAGILAGCKKDPTIGIVNVVRLVDGTPVVGATVHFQVDSNPKSGFHLKDAGFVNEYEAVTNSSGKIELEFELPSLITVTATLLTDSTALVGVGKLNLVAEETTNLKVEMN